MKQFLQHILTVAILTFGLISITGCSGGEANYSLDEVQGNGGILFLSASSIAVQKDASPVLELDVRSESPVVYSIVSGAESALFDINQSENHLVFSNNIIIDDEFTDDTKANNIVIQAEDSTGKKEVQSIVIYVYDNLNDAKPIVVDNYAKNVSIVHNDLIPFTTIEASNPRVDGAGNEKAMEYTLSNNSFIIDQSTGELKLKSGVNVGTYMVVVTITDVETGFFTATDTITVTVVATAAELKPEIVVDKFYIEENSLGNKQIVVNSNIPGTLEYSRGDLFDSSKFYIDIDTGVLSFINAPDYENSKSVGLENIYKVEVKVKDGNDRTDTKVFEVEVFGIDEGVALNAEIIRDSFGSSKYYFDSSGKVRLNNWYDYDLTFTGNPIKNGDIVTYSITGTDSQNPVLVISGNTIRINIKNTSDEVYLIDVNVADTYENSSTYSLIIDSY